MASEEERCGGGGAAAGMAECGGAAEGRAEGGGIMFTCSDLKGTAAPGGRITEDPDLPWPLCDAPVPAGVGVGYCWMGMRLSAVRRKLGLCLEGVGGKRLSAGSSHGGVRECKGAMEGSRRFIPPIFGS